jgi:hypothetical protein
MCELAIALVTLLKMIRVFMVWWLGDGWMMQDANRWSNFSVDMSLQTPGVRSGEWNLFSSDHEGYCTHLVFSLCPSRI